MTKRRKQGLVLLALSVPMMWWGFNQFIYGSGHSTLEAIAVSLSCTGGLSCLIGGIYMFFTKEKGRGEILHKSQTKVGFSPIQKEIINKKQKVNEMAKAKEFELADAVEEFRSLGGDIKKANLVVKTATEKRAVLKDKIAKNKFSIDEDGKLDTIKQ